VPGGFFEGFAPGGINEALIFFQMTGRLIQYQSTASHLLNQQKTALIFNDGGNGGVRGPAHLLSI
jgi:hypothetical protein